MTFATEIVKATTERNLLCRVEVARLVADADKTGASAPYTVTVPATVVDIEIDGVSGTEVSAAPASDGEWRMSSGDLEVYMDTKTDSLVIYHYLHFTNEIGRYYTEDPESAESASNPMTYWEPRLISDNSFKQTMRNYIGGLVTIGASPITINNADNFIQDYLGDNYTFSNKEFKIWMIVNDQIKLMQTGDVSAISVDKMQATFRVNDPTNKLKATALMGDNELQAYMNEDYWFQIHGVYQILGKDKNQPIPFHFGKVSAHIQWITDDSPINFRSGYGNIMRCTKYEKGLQSAISAYDYNRTWCAGRVGANGFRAQSWGTPTRTLAYNSTTTYYYIADHDFNVGDSVAWNSGTDLGTVFVDKDFTYSSNDYNLAVRSITGTQPPTTVSNYDAMDFAPILSWQDKSEGFLVHSANFVHGKHFTYTLYSTTGGNKLVYITLSSGTNSPEYSRYGSESTKDDYVINPKTDELYYALKPDDYISHGEGVEGILTKSGLTVNSASITQADSDFSANLAYQLPKWKKKVQTDLFDSIDTYVITGEAESKFPTNLEAVQEILVSTNGYILLNSSGEIEYKILSAPSSGDAVDGSDYNDLKISVSYNDIVTQLKFENYHLIPSSPINDDYYQFSYEETYYELTDDNSEYFYGHEKVKTLVHALDYDSIAANAQTLFDIRNNPRVRYTYTTSSRDLDSDLGDDIALTTPMAIDSSGTDDIKIVSIEKKASGTTIEADSFGGL